MSKVNLQEMDKIGQLFDRQSGYLKSGQTFIQANCVPRGYTGVLSFLEGHYQRCYDAGNTGMGNGVKIADKSATTIRANRAVYVQSDREAYELLRKNNPNLPPYTEPKGQLPVGSTTSPSSSSPSVAQRIWDGTKWVTKTVDTGAGYAKKAFDTHNDWWNSNNKQTRIDKQGKPLKDAGKLGGGDTDWLEDPWGTLKKKVSAAAKDADAKSLGYKDGDAYDNKMTNKFQDAYKDKSDKDVLSTGSSKNQSTVATAIDVVQKPQELISTGEDLWKEIQQVGEEIDRSKKISALAGTDNTGSTTWANDNGGTW